MGLSNMKLNAKLKTQQIEKLKSKSYLLTLISLILALVTSNLDIHTDIRTAIYGLSALGLILGGYLSIRKPKENKEV